MALALDGSATSSTATVALTTALAGVICVVATINGASIVSIADDAGNTYAKRVEVTTGGGNRFEFWYAVSQAGAAGNNITLTLSGAASFIRVSAWGVSGADLADPFDENESLPDVANGVPADPRAVTTTAADTFIIGAFRMFGEGAPEAGEGYTGILSGVANTFTLTEYKIVSEPQSSLSVTVGVVGGGNADVGIADAIKAAAVVVEEDIAVTAGSYWAYRKRIEEDEQERDARWDKRREQIERISRLVDGVSEKIPDDVPEAQVVKEAEAAVEKAAEKLTEDVPPPAFDYAGLAKRVRAAKAAVKQAEAALQRYEARKRREMEEQDDEDVLLLMG